MLGCMKLHLDERSHCAASDTCLDPTLLPSREFVGAYAEFIGFVASDTCLDLTSLPSREFVGACPECIESIAAVVSTRRAVESPALG